MPVTEAARVAWRETFRGFRPQDGSCRCEPPRLPSESALPVVRWSRELPDCRAIPRRGAPRAGERFRQPALRVDPPEHSWMTARSRPTTHHIFGPCPATSYLWLTQIHRETCNEWR